MITHHYQQVQTRVIKELISYFIMSNLYVRPGVIEGFVGPMASGKSKKLLERIDPLRWMNGKYSYLGFKPKVDSRKTSCRSSENFIDWIYIDENRPEDILRHISKAHDVIAIDEIQFFNRKIIKVILELQKIGKNIIFAGLDLDFRGEPFPPIPGLIAFANELHKCHAICNKCGEPAYYTQKLINGKPAHFNSPIVSIEGRGIKESYESRCFKHHEIPKN